MKKYILLFIILLLNSHIFSLELNIHEIISLQIPEEFEVISVTETLQNHSKSDQYALRIVVEYIYSNKHLYLIINLFGYGDQNKFTELAKILNFESTNSYYPNYMTADQIKFLKQNYAQQLEMTSEGMEFSRLVSAWASGYSADYYGFYFKINHNFFSEVIIYSINCWQSFNGVNLQYNDMNFRQKINTLNTDGQRLILYMDYIIESVETQTARSDIVYNPFLVIDNPNSLPGYWIPTIENLRLRDGSALDSNILGFVKDRPYRIIDIGSPVQIDGIDGYWYRIASLIGTETGWAFSGYLRELREGEIEKYFEGI